MRVRFKDPDPRAGQVIDLTEDAARRAISDGAADEVSDEEVADDDAASTDDASDSARRRTKPHRRSK